jgi:phosphatidylglycerol lysyltransferase
MGSFREEYIRRNPVAVVFRGEKAIAFANLWPGGEGQEVSPDLMRYATDAPAGTMEYLFTKLMLWGREEGYQWFNLGMAPLSGLEGHDLAPLHQRVGHLVFRHGEHFYNFQGLRQYKDKWDPIWLPRYVACPSFALPRVLLAAATLIGGGLEGVLRR